MSMGRDKFMALAWLVLIVWVLSGITFDYFHECQCPDEPKVEKKS